ncbi:hypothetical protein [Rhodanobacter lindaniclasticus]|uniref:hypothetical protein n=1 Tax=Rhodanobacter lindaniclasticus TaxID=75310 RepID=UPI001FE99A80|nr:hypothetical protein [Rhodanobacter lindaniclasticus]
MLDLLRSPFFSTDCKSKVNGSISWTLSEQWSTAVYFNHYGRSPNTLGATDNNYTDEGTDKLPAWILYNASVTYTPTVPAGQQTVQQDTATGLQPCRRHRRAVHRDQVQVDAS